MTSALSRKSQPIVSRVEPKNDSTPKDTSKRAIFIKNLASVGALYAGSFPSTILFGQFAYDLTRNYFPIDYRASWNEASFAAWATFALTNLTYAVSALYLAKKIYSFTHIPKTNVQQKIAFFSNGNSAKPASKGWIQYPQLAASILTVGAIVGSIALSWIPYTKLPYNYSSSNYMEAQMKSYAILLGALPVIALISRHLFRTIKTL